MGPLTGIRVIEFVNAAPGTFCAMLLAELGAEVVQIERRAGGTGADGRRPAGDGGRSPLFQSQARLAVDLKSDHGRAAVLRAIERADVLIEGFRPGVMERLGLGADQCLERNGGLVYGRITGWGQDGPLAQAAGHDISYIALSGALHAIGPAGGAPSIPLTLVGDFGGGGLLLALGIVSALLERGRSGKGQVVDAAMIDGALKLMSVFYGLQQIGGWTEARGTNLLDGGAHFYNVYETADGKYVVVGALLPAYYAELLRRLKILDVDPGAQHDRTYWPAMKRRLAEIFQAHTRDEWCAIFDGSDVGFAPVLSLEEAPQHPHNQFRRAFVSANGSLVPAPAPRFSRSSVEEPGAGEAVGDAHVTLARWGVAATDIQILAAGTSDTPEAPAAASRID